MFNCEKENKNFTLIELLVCIAILGILVSMLMPALSKARQKVKVTTCLNNHKQIAVALQLYAEDYDGMSAQHMWYSDLLGGGGSYNTTWLTPDEERPLNLYMGRNYNIAKCPSDKGNYYNGSGGGSPIHKAFGNSYTVKYATAINIDFSTNVINSNGKAWSSGIKVSSFKYPDFKVVNFAWVLKGQRYWDYAPNRWHDNKKPYFPVSFIDGHAEYHDFFWKEFNHVAPNVGGILNRIDVYGYY